MVTSLKQELRLSMKKQRALLFEKYPEAGNAIADLFFDFFHFPACTLIGGYWPRAHELDTRPLLRHLTERGFSCALPCVVENKLFFRLWDLDVPLVKGEFQIYEPSPIAPFVEPSVLLIPLLGFNKNGGRLGYGKGHYDRYLAQHAVLKIGVGFDGQEVKALPIETHDIPLDYILTNKTLLPINQT